MAPSRQKRLIAELGLLDEPEPTNPIVDLGLDQEFAGNLLQEDPTGAALRLVADGLYKVHAKRLYPDVPVTGDAQKYRKVQTADKQIATATVASLSRWTTTPRAQTVSPQLAKLRVQQEHTVSRAADMLVTDMEQGTHPLHFSHLEQSQGLLLRRNEATLMLTKTATGLNVVRAAIYDKAALKASETLGPQASDFKIFMKNYDSFGLEPDLPIATVIDHDGRASVLRHDMSFMMDITDPVDKHRRAGSRACGWTKPQGQLMFINHTPGRLDMSAEAQVVDFSEARSRQYASRRNTWELPLQIAGSIADDKAFARMRHGKAAGAAILGGSNEMVMSHFNLLATSARNLVEQDAGYSPLLTPGTTVALYDPANRMPVLTDATIIGLLGSELPRR